MSAAEKLKALAVEERDGDLWLALPQIVAVVEAAETIRNKPYSDKLSRALAALDEALGDVT